MHIFPPEEGEGAFPIPGFASTHAAQVVDELSAMAIRGSLHSSLARRRPWGLQGGCHARRAYFGIDGPIGAGVGALERAPDASGRRRGQTIFDAGLGVPDPPGGEGGGHRFFFFIIFISYFEKTENMI